MPTNRLFVLTTLTVLGLFVLGARITRAEVAAVIGTGTAASCQTADAVNAFSAAVAAGGVVGFNCGPEPVIIEVNTSLTDQTVTVNGDGLITLSGEDLRQIFYVTGSGHLTLNSITLIDGGSGQGGAIFINQQAAATINNSFVSSSTSSGDGGGIYNRGTLTVNDSTLGSNIAATNGGGIFNNAGTVTIRRSYLISNQSQSGGAIYTVNGQVTLERSAVRSSFIADEGGGIFVAGPTQITNSTFSNNRALSGGALFLVHNATILNTTFNENRADQGGAIWRQPSSSSTIKNSILAGSLYADGSGPNLNCDGPAMTSLGRNIVSDGSCLPNPGSSGDLFNTAPELGIWLGSPVRAYIPQPGSPAIDYGLDCPAIDQRGFPRPLGSACDVGSVEFGALLFLPFLTN